MNRRHTHNASVSGRLLRTSIRHFDVIIVGSGIAGLLLANEMDSRGLRALLLCKGGLADSNTSKAQGGLAAVTGDNAFDSPDQHFIDTIKSGAGLTDPTIARMMVNDGARLIARLEETGVRFDRTDGRRDLAREGGHGHSRVLHSKDSSGKAITDALIEMVMRSNRLVVREYCFVSDLLTYDGACVGVRMVAADRETTDLYAKHVVLCTGGLGQVFERTTNPEVATGDGIAMAYRAGARLVDMEFVQFHPTALAIPGQSTFLVSEAVRGAGAVLLDKAGERFAFKFSSSGELSTRDIVARAIHSTMLEEGSQSVQLDLRPIGANNIAEKFPAIVSACKKRGVNPLTEPVPIAPAAHYFMGGILTDSCGRTDVPGLYAIGECASTGLHGANRLASNSLLEGGVMALRLADYIAGNWQLTSVLARPKNINPDVILTTRDCTADNVHSFKRTMGTVAGLVRNADRLSAFQSRRAGPLFLPVPMQQKEIEAANIGLLGGLIVHAALNRNESRGAHWRLDYPESNDAAYLRRFYLSKEGNGWLPVGELGQATPANRGAARA